MNYIETIQSYQPRNEQERVDQKVMLEAIKVYGDEILHRHCTLAHLTASSWIVNKEKTKVLMAYHNIYQSWAWSGGHVDGMHDLLEVAIKEAKEETGVKHIEPLSEQPASLEIITVNPHIKRGNYVNSHLHLNVTYYLVADENDELFIKEDENSGVQWVPIEQAVELSNEEEMKVIYRKLNQGIMG